MKHLITRLLLVMICACAIPTAGNAFTLTIAGKANFMDSETVQSPEDSWKTNFVSQTISGDTGDFYFWATGNFKLSQANPAPTDWNTFNTNDVFQITETRINWDVHDVSNLGTGRKFIHLHIGTGGSNSVKVQDEPFAGHEGVWSTTPFKEGETIYYFPNEKFKSSDAIFRAVFNDGTTVLCQTDEYDPDYYIFTVPKEGLTAVKIERGKADQSNWWGNFTAELKSKDKGSNNCITMDPDNGNNWSSAPSSWTNYVPLTEYPTYAYYFCSRSNESEAWQPQTLVPEYGKCSFTRSDLSGKQFAIRVDVNDKQRYWFIPATDIEFTTTKSYSLTSAATNDSRTFPSDAPASEYTFVIEFKDNKPSRLRVNPTAAAYNQTLFVGIASSNRHQIQYSNGAYKPYQFYVNQEDLDNDGKFGFRFYSEPNGGVWMGNNEFGKVFGTDINFDTEITTSGIKRYFLKETGAYAINVKSYVPETNTVVFSLSKLADDAIVAHELYIGGTWNNGLVNETEKLQIPSSHGKYQPVKITVDDNCAFRFYSEKTNGNWMGPVYTDGINVDAEGTLPYTTVGNGNTFKLAEAGTYTIKVSEYLADNNKVTFTVTKEADPSFTVPTTLYLRNSRNWDDTPIAMTRQDGAGDNDRNTCKFFAEVDYNANEDFQFNFIEKNESNWPDRGIVCYPSTKELSVSANTPARIDNVGTCTDNPDKAWTYKSTEGGKITVSVYFKKNGYATVEVVGNSDKNYYFIGDMNNWFSNEFDGDLGGKDKNGETIARGINATRWEADKDNWKLEYVGDGWYRFDSFPGNLLSGHFQIVSNGSWELKDGNEIYSHVIYINPEDVKANKMSDYRAFEMNRITREDITKGREYRVCKRSADVSGGSNLGTQCNAVEGAVFWFNPGNDTEAPRIRITGTPKDYFIFYNMEKAGEGVFDPDMKISLNEQGTDEYWVRAAINSGKPNTNNYFLAGIEYGDYTLPFYDINGNTGAHMNVNEGIDLAPYDLKSMTERELNNLFFSNKDIVNSILKEGRLPNGRDIKVYDKVWIAKIPSGFENPAGTKYNMTFNKAMTDADRKATRTLTTRHYYFFPQQAGLHVHVNIDEILAGDKVESAKVDYRLYKTDNQYNTIAIRHGSDVTAEGHRKTEILHRVGSALPLTKDSEATNKIGWYECTKHNKSEWDAPSNIEDNWYVSWINGEGRREVAYDDNSVFVQFRLTIKMKQPASRAAEGEGETQVYYLPERVDVANDANHYWFENSDLYAKLKASDLPDGVLTGISEIVDDTDNGPAVYYNLQGVRVDNPAAGNIYIKVTRKGSEKILF